MDIDVGDDGRTRTGTIWTATTHVITAVIGSGVLALPWSVAQMGWIFGPIAIIAFAFVNYYTANLLSDCYRSPDPINGKRNYTYVDAVRSFLGSRAVFICGLVQYVMLCGIMIGYTVTAATSMMYVKHTNCVHSRGHNSRCGVSGTLFMIIFGTIQLIFSQFPNLEKITLLSVVAAAMSFAYSFIGLYLCVEKFASHHVVRDTSTGVKIGTMGISSSAKTWHSFQALGNIAFSYSFAVLLIEIQDTLKSPPAENKTMKKASMFGIGITTLFYISLGCVGYAAFGNDSPGNVLTGFYEPFWLVSMAHLAVIIHLVGAYQVFSQPIFALHEKWLSSKWPKAGFFHTVHKIRLPFTKARSFQFTLFKLFERTVFVVFTTVVAMMFPFFNAIMGLLGAVSFWPLTIYFPVSMYIVQAKIKRGSKRWLMLQSLSIVTLLISLVAAIGSVVDIVQRLKHVKLFSITF